MKKQILSILCLPVFMLGFLTGCSSEVTEEAAEEEAAE